MSRRRVPSLFARLAAVIAAVLAVGALVLGIAAWSYARLAADDAYDRLLVGAALQIAESIAVEDGDVVVDPPISAFETLSLSRGDRVFYKVLDTRGDVITGYADLTSPRAVETASDKPALRDGLYRGAPVRMATIGRFVPDPGVRGWAHVVVAQTREGRSALTRDLTVRAVALVLGMSALALIAAMVAIRRALAPLAAVERALQARDLKDLSPLAVETPREVEALVGAINHFMARLSGRIGVMRRFIADAAHQIRTPLTALAGQIDLLATEARAEQRTQQLARIQERTGELGRLTNQLLTHAMVIHRSEAARFQRVDLVEIARRALQDGVPLSLDRALAVSLDVEEEPSLVRGDPVILREAASNVVQNAVRHGARTKLRVVVAGDASGRRIEVLDDGPGIPAADWERVLEPFQRRDDGPGTGLGLAIASDAMRAHGGAIWFEDRGEVGFAVVLSLPATAAIIDDNVASQGVA